MARPGTFLPDRRCQVLLGLVCRKSAAKSFIEPHSKPAVMPLAALAKVEKVYDKCWIAEPVLWTRWKHRGALAYLIGNKEEGPRDPRLRHQNDIKNMEHDRIGQRVYLFSKTFQINPNQ